MKCPHHRIQIENWFSKVPFILFQKTLMPRTTGPKPHQPKTLIPVMYEARSVDVYINEHWVSHILLVGWRTSVLLTRASVNDIYIYIYIYIYKYLLVLTICRYQHSTVLWRTWVLTAQSSKYRVTRNGICPAPQSAGCEKNYCIGWCQQKENHFRLTLSVAIENASSSGIAPHVSYFVYF